jgi:nucleotide-binding universal stress UspA family protein
MGSLKHVLVALDLADHAPLALTRAAALARACRARWTVLHVCKPGLDESARIDLRAQLATLVGTQTPAEVVVVPGDPARTIVEQAAARVVDLVVVGRRRHGDLQRLFFESAGEIVTRDAGCSVLAVAEPADGVAERPHTPRILCAVDLTDSSGATLKLAGTLARDTRAPLTVLHVVDGWNWPDAPPNGRDKVAALRSQMAWAAYERLAVLVSEHVPLEVDADSLVSFGVPSLQIVDAASTVGAHCLVLGAHSLRVLGHTLLGSTARYVLNDPPCSILLARPAARPKDRPLAPVLAELTARE